MAYDGAAFKCKIPVAVQSGRENCLPSFGEKLKLEREKRAITLEQISLSTKIGTRMLQALEEDKFNQLPGGVFNRGFVRAYARHVGLDEDQTIADYLLASGDSPRPDPTAAIDEADLAEAPESSPSRPIPWGLVAAVLLLAGLALLLWNRRQHKRDMPQETTSVESANVEKTSVPAAISQTSLPGDARAHGSVPGAAQPPLPAPVAVAAGKTSPATRVVAEVAAPGEFIVAIHAQEESWLSVTVDGKIVTVETLAEGNQRSVHGKSGVVVRAGNVGGLDFFFNGKKLRSQGDYGEVKTLTFGPTGLQPPAPSKSVAP